MLVMVGLYVFYALRLNTAEEEISRLDQQIGEQDARIAELAPFRDLQARLESKKPIADGIFRTRFLWDEFLQALAFVIPPDTSLDTLAAQASPINIQAPTEQTLSPPGAVTFTGVALPDYENVADFVVRMNTLPFLSNSQLNLAQLDRETFSQPAINFEVASELVTRAGEQGSELRIDAAPTGDEDAGSEAESPASIDLLPSQNTASRQNRENSPAGQHETPEATPENSGTNP